MQTPSGNRWQSNQESEVLFLGDSFSNIYSLGGMGWGNSAGFVEHLSAALAQPIDKIVINAGGADATRQALVQKINSGNDRLAGKRVLVYQFATREIFSGDWKLMDQYHPIKLLRRYKRHLPLIAEGITVTATIKAKDGAADAANVFRMPNASSRYISKTQIHLICRKRSSYFCGACVKISGQMLLLSRWGRRLSCGSVRGQQLKLNTAVTIAKSWKMKKLGCLMFIGESYRDDLAQSMAFQDREPARCVLPIVASGVFIGSSTAETELFIQSLAKRKGC